jgi:hypothetical protein
MSWDIQSKFMITITSKLRTATTLITGDCKHHFAQDGQQWEKTENGKSWELSLLQNNREPLNPIPCHHYPFSVPVWEQL